MRIDNICGARVCAVERDGNEIPGIRLPPIAVPLSTYTGWNVYRAHSPVSSPTARAHLSLARTKAEREAARDPAPLARRALRHPRGLCRQSTRGSGQATLVAERLLLAADAELCRGSKPATGSEHRNGDIGVFDKIVAV